MTTKVKGASFEDFQRLHDPMYGTFAPTHDYGRDLRKGCKRFIITAAQNATPVNAAWWAVLRSMAEHKNAELLVIPFRYKNATSVWTGSQQNAEHYAPEVRPFLWNRRLDINRNLTLMADVPIQPTRQSPLSSKDALSSASSAIFGHAKMQLVTVPTPGSRMAKIMTTTGACTVPNYTITDTGKVGHFHHTLSAVLVELKGSLFHLRQLHFSEENAACIDLTQRFGDNGKVTGAPRPLALGTGDTHVDAICPLVKEATYGRDGIVETLFPEHLIYADLLDGYSCNPHHEGNPFIAAAKYDSGRHNVEAEVDRAIRFVAQNTPKDVKAIIQACNHNDFLRRWIEKTDWKKDPANSSFYLKTALVMREGAKYSGKGTSYPDPFAYWFRNRYSGLAEARVLDLDEPFVLGDVALDMHGDIGPNGARGSIKNLRRIGTKSIIFHSHRPGIDEGCYQVGTSTHLRLEYNHGASGWLNAHGLLNADGKRQLIIIIDGHWRG